MSQRDVLLAVYPFMVLQRFGNISIYGTLPMLSVLSVLLQE